MSRKVGVYVGRFQCYELHEGYIAMIETIMRENDEVIIFIGVNGTDARDLKNPFKAKEIANLWHLYFRSIYYAHYRIFYQKDCKSDKIWSEELDERIYNCLDTRFDSQVTLYGGRDSFIKSYSGVYQCKEILFDNINVSSTYLRETLLRHSNIEINPDYLLGILKTLDEQYPTAFSTVDCAVIDYSKQQILLGRKPKEDKWRFFGGFVDPTDDSIENAAYRELYEETNLSISVESPIYVGNYKIDDWRYRGTKHSIFTNLYVFPYINSVDGVQPGDDIEEVKWFDLSKDIPMVEEHEKLLKHILNGK